MKEISLIVTTIWIDEIVFKRYDKSWEKKRARDDRSFRSRTKLRSMNGFQPHPLEIKLPIVVRRARRKKRLRDERSQLWVRPRSESLVNVKLIPWEIQVLIVLRQEQGARRDLEMRGVLGVRPSSESSMIVNLIPWKSKC